MFWHYTAVDERALPVAGVEAGSRRDVAARLLARGFHVVTLRPDIRGALARTFSGGPLPPAKLAPFFRDFAGMLEAGLTLEQVLRSLGETGADPRMAGLCRFLGDELLAGHSLAAAMAQSHAFPGLAVNALGAGERAGELSVVMGLLAEHFELTAALKDKAFGALIYPACVAAVLLAGMVYMSDTVVPQLAAFLPPEAFEEPLTRMMVAFSAGVRRGAPFFPALAVVCGAGMAMLRRSRGWDLGLARLPGISAIVRDLAISLCFFEVHLLLKSGIPLDAALGQAAAGARGLVAERLEACRRHLVAGHTFSGALAATSYFPRLVVDSVRLGEETGRLDEYCGRVFRLYYRSFEKRLTALTALLQPVLLGVCALFVTAMALAFLKPVYANLTQLGVLKP
jgi:type IV pilus assembly protein PilC